MQFNYILNKLRENSTESFLQFFRCPWHRRQFVELEIKQMSRLKNDSTVFRISKYHFVFSTLLSHVDEQNKSGYQYLIFFFPYEITRRIESIFVESYW